MNTMKTILSEKKILLYWSAFFGLMFIPFAIAIDIWIEIIGDNVLTDWLANLFLAATSYFAFRFVVRKILTQQDTTKTRKE